MISLATFSSSSSLRLEMTTFAPSLANSKAVAFPVLGLKQVVQLICLLDQDP